MKKKKSSVYDARSMSQAGLPYFKVSGGPLASEQIMGWRICNEKGFTAAVSSDDRFAKRLNDLEALATFIEQIDGYYQINRLREGGYIDMDDESWNAFRDVMKRLGIR